MSNKCLPTLSLQSLCEDTSVKFGTSGVRGLVSDLSETVCYAFTQAFLTTLCSNNKTVAVGRDLRPSSQTINNYVTNAANELGFTVMDCGELPTPALAYFAQQHNIPAIMITGSHIPFDRNGLKFYTAQGEITKQDEQIILSQPVSPQPTSAQLNKRRAAKKQTQAESAQALYTKRYQDAFPHDLLNGKRIGVYQHSSVSRDLLVNIIESLGAETIGLGRTDQFVPIDTEAVSEADQTQAINWSREHHLDAIVSTDGDGDRPLIADEKGQWLRGDTVGLLTCQYLCASHIATPLNSNTSLEMVLPEAEVRRTKIGSPYVIEALNAFTQNAVDDKHAKAKAKAIIGYEANGGVILASDSSKLERLVTRDAVLPILSCLALAQKTPLSHVVANVSLRHTASERIKDIPCADSKALIEKLATSAEYRTNLLNELPVGHNTGIVNIDQLDGLRLTLANQEIIHLRASGNADELRCYAESDSSERVQELCKQTMHWIKTTQLVGAESFQRRGLQPRWHTEDTKA